MILPAPFPNLYILINPSELLLFPPSHIDLVLTYHLDIASLLFFYPFLFHSLTRSHPAKMPARASAVPEDRDR